MTTKHVSLHSFPKPPNAFWSESFHDAAALDGEILDLSADECLHYKTRKAYPGANLKTIEDAKRFLAALERGKAERLQKEANEMFGMAKFLAEGDIDIYEDGKKVIKKDQLPIVRTIYSMSPDLTLAGLKSWTRQELFVEGRLRADAVEELEREVKEQGIFAGAFGTTGALLALLGVVTMGALSIIFYVLAIGFAFVAVKEFFFKVHKTP